MRRFGFVSAAIINVASIGLNSAAYVRNGATLSLVWLIIGVLCLILLAFSADWLTTITQSRGPMWITLVNAHGWLRGTSIWWWNEHTEEGKQYWESMHREPRIK